MRLVVLLLASGILDCVFLGFTRFFSAISSIQWIGWQSNYRNAIDYMASVDKYRLGKFITALGNLSIKNRLRDRFSGLKSRQVR